MSQLNIAKVRGLVGADALQLGEGSSGTLNAVQKAITMPNRPAFLAYRSSVASAVTGDGTVYAPYFGAEVFDKGADYNAATGVFTAPVTGTYRFESNVQFDGIVSGHGSLNINLVTSNRTCSGGRINAFAVATAGGSLDVPGSWLVDMDAGDTAIIQVTVSGGTKVVDVYGEAGAGTLYSYFSGVLVG